MTLINELSYIFSTFFETHFEQGMFLPALATGQLVYLTLKITLQTSD